MCGVLSVLPGQWESYSWTRLTSGPLRTRSPESTSQETEEVKWAIHPSSIHQRAQDEDKKRERETLIPPLLWQLKCWHQTFSG